MLDDVESGGIALECGTEMGKEIEGDGEGGGGTKLGIEVEGGTRVGGMEFEGIDEGGGGS